MTEAARRLGALTSFAGISFAYFAYAGLFGTYAPLWFAHLGFDALAIGLLLSLQSATRVFTPYAWAWVADHSGERVALLRLAALASLVAACGLFVSPAYAWVALVVVLLFVATAGVVPLAEAALADWVSDAGGALDVRRYGRVRVWGSVGFIAAVATSGFALDALGVPAFPALTVALLGGLVLAALRLPLAHDAARRDGAAGRALPRLREPEVGWFFAATFLTVLAHGAMYAFFSLYLASLGYGKGAIGLVWAAGVAAEVLWFWFQGRWFGRLGLHHWLLIAALVTAARFAAVAAFGANTLVIVVAQCTHAITFAAQHTACIAFVNQHFPGRQRGRGQALYAVIGYGASGVVAGLAGGALVTWIVYSAVFWAASAAGLLAAACCRMAMRAGTAR